jgi:hypothetical protein
LPSVSNHSPASSAVSSPGSTPPENAGETDPLDALIRQSERAAACLLEMQDDPSYQAALAELAAQSDAAIDALFAQQQATVGPLSPGGPHMIATPIPAGVHSSDLIQALRRERLEVRPHRLRYAASQGHIPQPFRLASGDFAWRPADVAAVVTYFRNPRRPGRPRKAR